MLIVLSPAKLFHTIPTEQLLTYQPLVFEDKTSMLMNHLKTYDKASLCTWMKMSDALGELNRMRYQTFEELLAYPAADYFNGEVYKQLEASGLNEAARAYLQDHLFILSGLYGMIGW